MTRDAFMRELAYLLQDISVRRTGRTRFNITETILTTPGPSGRKRYWGSWEARSGLPPLSVPIWPGRTRTAGNSRTAAMRTVGFLSRKSHWPKGMGRVPADRAHRLAGQAQTGREALPGGSPPLPAVP